MYPGSHARATPDKPAPSMGGGDFQAELPRADNGNLYERLLLDRYWKGHATRIL